jgi:hypothetical protein
MATITTIFRPDPTCFAASNLWLDVTQGTCDTYYPPFAPRPTEILPPLVCTSVELGYPRYNASHHPCHQTDWIPAGATIGNIAYTACPEGMTDARTQSGRVGDISVIVTTCCPT